MKSAAHKTGDFVGYGFKRMIGREGLHSCDAVAVMAQQKNDFSKYVAANRDKLGFSAQDCVEQYSQENVRKVFTKMLGLSPGPYEDVVRRSSLVLLGQDYQDELQERANHLASVEAKLTARLAAARCVERVSSLGPWDWLVPPAVAACPPWPEPDVEADLMIQDTARAIREIVIGAVLAHDRGDMNDETFERALGHATATSRVLPFIKDQVIDRVRQSRKKVHQKTHGLADKDMPKDMEDEDPSFYPGDFDEEHIIELAAQGVRNAKAHLEKEVGKINKFLSDLKANRASPAEQDENAALLIVGATIESPDLQEAWRVSKVFNGYRRVTKSQVINGKVEVYNETEVEATPNAVLTPAVCQIQSDLFENKSKEIQSKLMKDIGKTVLTSALTGPAAIMYAAASTAHALAEALPEKRNGCQRMKERFELENASGLAAGFAKEPGTISTSNPTEGEQQALMVVQCFKDVRTEMGIQIVSGALAAYGLSSAGKTFWAGNAKSAVALKTFFSKVAPKVQVALSEAKAASPVLATVSNAASKLSSALPRLIPQGVSVAAAKVALSPWTPKIVRWSDKALTVGAVAAMAGQELLKARAELAETCGALDRMREKGENSGTRAYKQADERCRTARLNALAALLSVGQAGLGAKKYLADKKAQTQAASEAPPPAQGELFDDPAIAGHSPASAAQGELFDSHVGAGRSPASQPKQASAAAPHQKAAHAEPVGEPAQAELFSEREMAGGARGTWRSHLADPEEVKRVRRLARMRAHMALLNDPNVPVEEKFAVLSNIPEWESTVAIEAFVAQAAKALDNPTQRHIASGAKTLISSLLQSSTFHERWKDTQEAQKPQLVRMRSEPTP